MGTTPSIDEILPAKSFNRFTAIPKVASTNNLAAPVSSIWYMISSSLREDMISAAFSMMSLRSYGDALLHAGKAALAAAAALLASSTEALAQWQFSLPVAGFVTSNLVSFTTDSLLMISGTTLFAAMSVE